MKSHFRKLGWRQALVAVSLSAMVAVKTVPGLCSGAEGCPTCPDRDCKCFRPNGWSKRDPSPKRHERLERYTCCLA